MRPAGFGLLCLLVVLAWAQAGVQGRLGGWAIGGGVAAVALCVAVDRLAPAWLAIAPAVLVPVAVVALTSADPGNIGGFVLVFCLGFMALGLPFVPGLVGWFVAVLVLVVLAVTSRDAGWPNWIAGTSIIFWFCWAGRHRIELIERLHRAEAAASTAATVTERQRLAGDLHDIVAHTLAVTVLHLGGARLALAHEPGEAEAGIAEAVGVATSEAVHIAVAAAGLTALFAAVPIAFTVVRIAGSAYLIYLGVQLIRHRNSGQGEVSAVGGISGRRAYLRGLLINLLNPKMITFTIAFLPQLIDPQLGRVWVQFAILGAIMIVLEFLVDGTVGVLGGRIGGWLQRRHAARRRIDVATGGLFIGLACDWPPGDDPRLRRPSQPPLHELTGAGVPTVGSSRCAR